MQHSHGRCTTKVGGFLNFGDNADLFVTEFASQLFSEWCSHRQCQHCKFTVVKQMRHIHSLSYPFCWWTLSTPPCINWQCEHGQSYQEVRMLTVLAPLSHVLLMWGSQSWQVCMRVGVSQSIDIDFLTHVSRNCSKGSGARHACKPISGEWDLL